MNDRQSLPWTRHLSSDLVAVTRLMESGQSAHLGFVDTIVRAAVARNRFVASSLLMLGTRALGNDAAEPLDASTLHAFAAAMELIVLSLDGHANLPDQSRANPDEPLLSLGPAVGVLLGDLLYTRAFRLIVQTGHERGLAEVARITERMVLGATSERFPAAAETNAPTATAPATQSATLLTATYAGCASLAALLGGATPQQHQLLERLGTMCGRLQSTQPQAAADGSGNGKGKGKGTHANGNAADASTCKALAGEIFEPSEYRDDICALVDFLATSPASSHP